MYYMPYHFSGIEHVKFGAIFFRRQSARGIWQK